MNFLHLTLFEDLSVNIFFKLKHAKNLSFFYQLWTSDTQGDEAEAGEGGEN